MFISGVANRTYVSPCVAGAMNLMRGSEYVRGIAKIWEPHVLDMCVIQGLHKCSMSITVTGDVHRTSLVYGTIKLMSLQRPMTSETAPESRANSERTVV
jgi:hypothetical protein